MMGQRHLPTNIQTLNHEHDHTMHQKKLEEIHKEKTKKTLDKEATLIKNLQETRERNIKFHHTEKAVAIEKDNQLLLGKLVEISRKKKPNLFPAKEINHSGTLNGPSRRREKDRIAQENEAFARRLLSQQPSFNRKKLENDYEKHNDRVKNMQRLGLSPRTRKAKLPPLTDPKSKTLEESKSKKSLNQKKSGTQIGKVQEEQEGDTTGEEDTRAELAKRQIQEEKKRREEEEEEEVKRRYEEQVKKENEATKAKADADAEEKAKADADAKAKADADAKAKADADAKVNADADAEEKAKADADAKAKADADAKVKADADAKAKADADAKVKADADAKAKADADAKAKADADAKAKADADAKAKADAEAEAKGKEKDQGGEGNNQTVPESSGQNDKDKPASVTNTENPASQEKGSAVSEVKPAD